MSDFTIITWNIGHLSDNTTNRPDKLAAIKKLLNDYEPAVLVLQEVNMLSNLDSSYLKTDTNIQYKLGWGPLMKSGNSEYTSKTGTQYEYYPIIYSPDVDLGNTLYCLPKSQDSTENIITTVKDHDLLEWVSDRPIVIREIQHKVFGKLALGVVHTSPSFRVELTARNAVFLIDSIYSGNWLLAGDWYVASDMNIPIVSGPKKTWGEYLSGLNLHFWRPQHQTNFPSSGEGMVADYFVASQKWTLADQDPDVISVCKYGNSSAYANNPGKQWADLHLSDHAPVVGLFIPG